ncbi:MAG: hypothetical protein H6744_09255 [Deltaproteobacteria bacterium]|nr:hypothetical protein [Deltaproteobacteria bacterium]
MARSRWTPVAVLVTAGAMLLAACGDSGSRGSLTLGLTFEDAGWFQLRVFEGPATELLTAATGGRLLFDTGCLEIRSRTFEITDLEAGDDRSVVYEAFTGADCRRETRVSLGYRGGITVVAPPAEQPYYHVPLYNLGAVTPLPEDINLSASLAVRVDVCEVDAECADVVSPNGGCFKLPSGTGSNFWCVPTCRNSADCQTIQPRAVCDADLGWCFLRSPFPLNMEQPRAFGGAFALGNGDVLLAGGFGGLSGGNLIASGRAFERFDAGTGLFVRETIDGVPATAVGLSGYARLGPDRFAQAGGVLSVALTPGKAAPGFTLQIGSLGGDTCNADGCEPNVTDRLLIFDTARGRGAISRLPARLAMPAVVATTSEVLVIGGATPNGSGDAVDRSAAVWTCAVDAAMSAECEKLLDMSTGRAGASASCLDAACERILVLGGNATGAGLELIDRTGETPVTQAFTGPGSLGAIFGPQLCGDLIVGGGVGTTSAGGLGFNRVTTDEGLRIVPLETESQVFTPLFAAASALPGGGCWLAGGIDPAGGVLASVRRVTEQAVAPQELALSSARFGASAATIGSGPLAGGVIFAGGLDIDRSAASGSGDSGRVVFVRGAEVLRP